LARSDVSDRQANRGDDDEEEDAGVKHQLQIKFIAPVYK